MTILQSTVTRRVSSLLMAVVLTACGTTSVATPQATSPEEQTATASRRPAASPVETGPVAEPFEVTVGGLQIAGHCTGSRTEGLPVVILQSGNGATDTQLASIEQHLSERTMVCAYSRPGAGRSDAPADLPRPVSAVVSEMHGVLESLDLPAPYFPIGGSAGAVVAFMFAQAYPDEVAGLVFMNGNPPYDSWVAEAVRLDLHPGMVDGAEADYSGDNPEGIDFRANESMLTTPLPASLPYAVMYDENYSFDPNLREFQEAEAALYERMAGVGEGGRFIWARGAGHEIHLSMPQLVHDTIDEVWTEATD